MTDTITLPRSVIKQAIATVGYYASVVGEDDQDTPAKQTQSALRAALAQQAPAKQTQSALRAALAQQEKQGWVRVPVEPTPAMIKAYACVPCNEHSVDEECRSGWHAMLKAAPKGGV